MLKTLREWKAAGIELYDMPSCRNTFPCMRERLVELRRYVLAMRSLEQSEDRARWLADARDDARELLEILVWIRARMIALRKARENAHVGA